MQEINVKELIPHPKNDYFFDDMTGQKWKEFLESVKTSGVIESIVITQNKVIVSGHQRVRACKELGIKTIKTEIRLYDNDDKVIKDLIETNLRQRGDISSSSLKMGRIIVELERIYGVRQGSANKKGTLIGEPTMLGDVTQQDIANKMNIENDETYRNYKKLTTLIPELQSLVDKGSLTTSVASRILARLSAEEQKKLILTYGKDEIENATQKKAQEMIDELTRLKNINSGLEMKLKNKDIEIANSVNAAKEQLNNKILELTTTKEMLERKVRLNQEDSDRYNKLKSDIEFLTKQKSNLGRQIESATELSGMTVRLQKLLEEELAPIKFKRCMETLDSDDICIENLSDIIYQIDKWSDEMKKILTKNNCDYVVDIQ
ncbi:ParB N-terminal domain-containing protein [Lachnospiraceae bacterium 54-53]